MKVEDADLHDDGRVVTVNRKNAATLCFGGKPEFLWTRFESCLLSEIHPNRISLTEMHCPHPKETRDNRVLVHSNVEIPFEDGGFWSIKGEEWETIPMQ